MQKIVFLALILASSSGLAATTKVECGRFDKAIISGNSTHKLKKFIDTQWTYFMMTYPEWATWVGASTSACSMTKS